MRMRYNVICGRTRYKNFFQISHKRLDFRKSYKAKHVFCVSLKVLSETFFILTVIERDMNILFSM